MEKPILFNTDMVLAILDGRKTVTRRIIPEKIVDAYYSYDDWCSSVMPSDIPCTRSYENDFFMDRARFKVGDFLYVRETYCPNYFDKEIMRIASFSGNGNAYKADYHKENIGDIVPEPKWTPSIHMPKAAARIWLKVTGVGVEQLKDMNPVDVINEGAYADCQECISTYGKSGTQCCYQQEDECNHCDSVMMEWERLWNSTVKKLDLETCGWNANPWVWVIKFERCEKPEQDGAE